MATIIEKGPEERWDPLPGSMDQIAPAHSVDDDEKQGVSERLIEEGVKKLAINRSASRKRSLGWPAGFPS